MKLVFLGTGSAFTLENYQSNMVVEGDDGLLLIDCGSDARRSAANLGWSAFDITDVYVRLQPRLPPSLCSRYRLRKPCP